MSVRELSERPGGVIGKTPTAGSGIWTLDSLRQYLPLSIPGLQLWLDASDPRTLFDAASGGSPAAPNIGVGRWEDKSGNARHATQGTSESRPLRKTGQRNGRDALLFDGINDFLATATHYHTNNVSVFVVSQRNAKAPSGQSGHALFQTGASAGIGYACADAVTSNIDNCFARGVANGQVGSVASTAWRILSITYTAGDRKVYVNGTLADTEVFTINTPNTSSGIASYIGAIDAVDYEFDGYIAEMIAYNRVLSASERTLVERYLLSKWAI